MLVWHNIVFVFWVQRLVLRRDVDLVVWEFIAAEIFEEIGVSRGEEVNVGVVAVLGLGVLVGGKLGQ